MTFWSTDTWHEYERLCGDEPGKRSRLLASAEFNTRVVDLSVSEAELWRGVRRSYHALIHKAERDYIIDVAGAGSIYSAMQIHDDLAGKHTRSLSTWELMGEWIKAGNGLLVMAGVRRLLDITRCGDDTPQLIPAGLVEQFAYAFFSIFEQHAYYFSAASREPDVNHALIWNTMTALKARGVRYLELGWQGEAHDAKGKAIEWFKTGFGGYDVPAKEAPELCGQ